MILPVHVMGGVAAYGLAISEKKSVKLKNFKPLQQAKNHRNRIMATVFYGNLGPPTICKPFVNKVLAMIVGSYAACLINISMGY